jgi:hypothetical protein
MQRVGQFVISVFVTETSHLTSLRQFRTLVPNITIKDKSFQRSSLQMYTSSQLSRKMTEYYIRKLSVLQLTAVEYCKCRAASGLCFSSAIAATSHALKWTRTTSKETILTQFALKEPQKSHMQAGDTQPGTPCFHPRRYVNNSMDNTGCPHVPHF